MKRGRWSLQAGLGRVTQVWCAMSAHGEDGDLEGITHE